MSQYSEYHLNPKQYEFLSVFKQKWPEIRDEYLAFIQDDVLCNDATREIMTPQSKTIVSKQGGDFEAIGLLYHGKNFLQVIEDNQLTWPSNDTASALQRVSDIFHKHFQLTQRCIDEANQISSNGIRNVYFSVLKPGLEVKCHINYNPHIYRAYLGLLVPEGDIAMKICGETLHWKKGEILVLDHTYPHCPHNLTNKPRVALIIDFYQTDKNREKMIALEKSLIKKRMKSNSLGFGVFGDNDYVTKETLEKYGFTEQAEWNSLSTISHSTRSNTK